MLCCEVANHLTTSSPGLGKHGFFGELAVLGKTPQPYARTVRARTFCRLALLSKKVRACHPGTVKKVRACHPGTVKMACIAMAFRAGFILTETLHTSASTINAAFWYLSWAHGRGLGWVGNGCRHLRESLLAFQRVPPGMGTLSGEQGHGA